MKLLELVRGLQGISLEKGGEEEVSGIAYDSRRVERGDLFVAVRGSRTDGHLFLAQAVERGASALVVSSDWQFGGGELSEVAVVRSTDTRLALAQLSDRFHGHPSGRLSLVGVTGTNGKTTTAHLVEAASAHCGLTCGLVGTVSYCVAGREVPATRTTPESADLQAMLAEMVRAGCEVASMEVSSHALSLRRVDGCDFAVAVFTNLSQDHLDFHADMEDYYRSKERLFTSPTQGGLGARAAAVNRQLQEMNLVAAGLAHETKNPLNIIRTTAQLLCQNPTLPEEIRTRARQIIEEADRVTAQLNEFINYSRPREVRRGTVALSRVLEELRRTLSHDLEDKQIQFRCSDGLPAIEADEQLLRQALFNLLLNAIQAVPAGGQIEVAAVRTGPSQVALEVRDNGPGVPPEHRSEIFKPYFTTHPKGTGLGLAVVRQIVLAHGWDIEYVPNQPQGAIFRIFPVRVVSMAA